MNIDDLNDALPLFFTDFVYPDPVAASEDKHSLYIMTEEGQQALPAHLHELLSKILEAVSFQLSPDMVITPSMGVPEHAEYLIDFGSGYSDGRQKYVWLPGRPALLPAHTLAELHSHTDYKRQLWGALRMKLVK